MTFLINPFVFAAAGGGGAPVTSGLVLSLDPASYSSGQTWANDVDSPADGASQTAYDFYLGSGSGADGADPSHVGTYWLFGGGDYFTKAAAATAFLSSLHKAGAAYTIEAWWYSAGDSGNVNPIFDSGTSDQSGSDMSRGVIFGDRGPVAAPAGGFGLRVKRDSGGGTSLNAYLSTPPADNAWHQHAVSYTGGAGCFLWLDGAIAASNLGATTWDGALSSPGTLDAVNPPRIGARGDGAFSAANGSRLGVLRIYNRALSTTELLQNWNANRATYGL